MNKGYGQSQWSDIFNRSVLNSGGLVETQKNNFMKYTNSGFTEVNKLTHINQKSEVKITHETGTFNKIKNAQNEVLKQLRQQYDILKNLPISDKLNVKPKHERHASSVYSSSIDQQSDITSSKNHKKGSRQAQIWNLQKKQLEIVISNSLKKIQQLLTSEMQLKKVIHQQKLQIEGKGGIHSEYQLVIRNHKKVQKQLTQTITSLKIQLEKKNLSLKQLGQKLAFLEGQKSRKQNEYKSFFDEQRHLDDLLRKQKDRTLNVEIQNRRLQMEFQMMQKDKNAEIGRLTREIEGQGERFQRDKDMIQRFQEDIRERELKIEKLQSQFQVFKDSRPKSPPPIPEDSNKKALQELIKQMKAKELSAKDNNQAILRTLFDKLGNRKDQGLKNQISSIRLQLENIKKTSTTELQGGQESDLRYRIRQLEKTIESQKQQKRELQEQIDTLRGQAYNSSRRCEQLQQKIEELLHKIQELGNYKIQIQQSQMSNHEIKHKLDIMGHDHYKSGQQNDSEQLRQLRRQIDTLTFSLNKATEQKQFNQQMMQQSQSKQFDQLNQDLIRLKNMLRLKQEQCNRLNQNLRKQLEQKAYYSQQTNNRLQQIQAGSRAQQLKIRQNYESLIKAQVNKHYNQIQGLNKKIIGITKTNELFTQKSQYYLCLQKEVIELRKISRNSKKVNQTLDHLWEIKQTEYNNVNEILISVRNAY